jgi:hypothetical protein
MEILSLALIEDWRFSDMITWVVRVDRQSRLVGGEEKTDL